MGRIRVVGNLQFSCTINSAVCTVVYLRAQTNIQGFFVEMEAAFIPLGTPRPSATLGFLCAFRDRISSCFAD